MGMICIISNNQLPATFWKNYFQKSTIKQVSQEQIEELTTGNEPLSVLIIDDYFSAKTTSRKTLNQIAKKFSSTSVFHLSPENTFGINESSKVKFYSFSNEFFNEVSLSSSQ